MPQCSGCGAEHQPNDRFCADCGAPLAVVCPGCGAASEPGKRFCARCGTALAGSAGAEGRGGAPNGGNGGSAGVALGPLGPPGQISVPPGGAPGGQERPVSERRICSVLFADLVGFTSLSEDRDPEEVREILSRYFDVARRLISRYGGIVEKFIGDAVMAVWGTPVAGEGDTERAVRAALELVDAVGVLGAEVGAHGLRARAGVVTGEVAVTIGATGEGMVAGDAVNTASRVQSAAAPGTVLCDEATRKLSERAIAFEPAGTFELKGKEHPEELFRAARVLSGVGGKQRADGLEAPFTGRDAELRGMKDLFNTSAERRSPRLVVVSGPAGVGKSRLGWEFEKYIDGIADTVLWHRGRCLSYGEGVAFWALAEIVRQRFGIAEEDPTDVAATKLHEGMVRFVPDEAEREYVGNRLSRLLGVPYPSDTRAVLSKEELFAGWRLFFERLAQVAPVVMLVEDAHHADESLLGFFDHLIDWTRDLPIFVLLFARPGLEAIDSGFGVGRNRSTLSLDPLDDASMARLVESLVPGIPDPARDAITSRAQGIPLFAVETIRSLIDRGVVQHDRDAYRLAADLGDLTVPDSLHSLLAARLDALPGDVRALVADASVLGTSFPKDALVAVSARSEDDVLVGLAELVKRDVLQVFADPLSPERGAYRFSQEMLRQVAYETLSKKDRKARHLAVAAHLRSTFANDGEELADAIARHYLDALTAGGGEDDAEAITANALAFLIRAGERAERSGALPRAAESFAEAAANAEGERGALLFERASQASLDYGDFDGAIASADAARDRYRQLADLRGAARAQTKKGNALRAAGRHAEAREELTEALEVLRVDPDPDTVEGVRNLASLEVFSGNVVEGDRRATEALELGQALAVGVDRLGPLFLMKGIAASFANRSVEAVANYEMAARLAERAGDFGALALAQLNLADDLCDSDPRAAVEVARAAIGNVQRSGRRRYLAVAVANLAVALIEVGDWDTAEAVLRDAAEGDLVDHGMLYAMAGSLAGMRGDRAAAALALEAARASPTSEDPQALASIDLLEAISALCAGDRVAALEHAKRVLARREDVGLNHETQRWGWPLAARAARHLGEAAEVRALLTMLEPYPVGHLPAILRAERRLVHALSAAGFADSADSAGGAGSAGAGAGASEGITAVEEALGALRDIGNPYELAHGLVDYADVCHRWGNEPGPAVAALAEARDIAVGLRCPPLLARVDEVERLVTAADAPA